MLLKRAASVLLFGLSILVTSSAAVANRADADTRENAHETEARYVGAGKEGLNSAEFRLSYYHNADHGDGNPFVDERLTVVEHIMIVDYNISDRLSTWGQLAYDYVSSASVKRLDKFPNQSGASGDYYIGLDVGAAYELDEDRRVDGFVSASVEYDYRSFGIGGSFSRDVAQKDATVKLSTNGFFDIVDIIRFNGVQSEGTDNRISFSTTLSWYQILNSRTHSELGATFGYQNGFLETAYNAVVIEDPTQPPNPFLDNQARGTETTEKLPSTRLRGSVFGRTRYSLMPGTAIEIGGRLYIDDWGIFGFTAEPLVSHWFTDQLGLRLSYRYYTQTAADDFANHFTSTPARRTQDPDLAKFDSHGIRGALRWQMTDEIGLELSTGYTFRQDGIDQLTVGIGIRKVFGGLENGGSVWGH